MGITLDAAPDGKGNWGVKQPGTALRPVGKPTNLVKSGGALSNHRRIVEGVSKLGPWGKAVALAVGALGISALLPSGQSSEAHQLAMAHQFAPDGFYPDGHPGAYYGHVG